MPIGSSSVFARTMATLEHNRHRICSVLDLGIGMGMNGAGVRQWLDFGVRPWKTRLAGVEGWAPYRNPIWDLYDQVFHQTVQDYLSALAGTFDCILMTDVIEHMPKPQGEDTLREITASLSPSGLALVSTPAVFWEQGACHGNELERHVCLWTPDDFCRCGWDVAWDGTPDQYGQRMILATKGVA